MKGIIFNLAERVIVDNYGEDIWDELLTRADLEGSYTSLGAYPDRELCKIVQTASELLNKPANEMVRIMGRRMIPLLAAKYPEFFSSHTSTRSFLVTLNEIHVEVTKLFPGSDVPQFAFDTSSPDVLTLIYRSRRQMCSFAIGLIEGASDHYQEQLNYEHVLCSGRGDPECVIRASFTPAHA